MSKKNKRQAQRAAPTAAASTDTSTPLSKVSTARGSDRDFNPDYSYVIKDLKRIGLLAGTFFAILIVLSFFL
jgi:hypothetical protein